MSFPESFKNMPTPENTGQFSTELEPSERTALVNEAKQKFEGVILYAPIPEDIKKELLTRVGDVPTDDSEGLRAIFRERDLMPEQQASLWVDRWTRGAVQSLRDRIGDRDYEMLELALNKLWAQDSGYFNDMLAQWMDSGRKPPATGH